jgi:lipopolysaccharide transport system permease protein
VIVGAALTGHAHPTLAAVPIVWALMLIWLIGVDWILAMLNVAFRDLQNLIAVILMVLLVASPFAYTVAQLPPAVRLIVYLNPFAYFVVAFQDLIMLGRLPDAWHTAVLVLMSIGTFVLGSWFFSKAKTVLLDYV